MPLQNLNTEQYAAATAPMGHNLIIASAGTGKTSTIVGRIAHLLESGVQASEILLLTFTNKASQEMIARVASRFGEVAKQIECGTFHAVSYRFLKDKYAISLKQPKELKVLFKSIAKSRVYQHQTSTPPYSGEYLFDLYSLYLNSRNNESFEEWLGARGSDHSAYIDIYEGIFAEYHALKKSHNYMDYNDLLLEYAKEMRGIECPYKEILCDEYQDTNPLQNYVIHALNPKSLFCVGDYDQSIYAFNGADISIISSFTETYVDSRVFTLSKNYRSTRYILDLANRVIEKNERIYPKELEVINLQEPIAPKLLIYNELFEQYQGVAQKILTANYPLDDIAIIFRNNSSADGCEALLRELNIPSKRKGGVSFFDAKEVALMLDFCSLLYNPKDMMAYIHILSYGSGIGDSIARELYEGLLRLGNGDAKRGLLAPDSSVRAFEKRAKNAQLGLFDDFFALQDVKKFDNVVQGNFVGHPILSHPKLSFDGARFLSDFYAAVERKSLTGQIFFSLIPATTKKNSPRPFAQTRCFRLREWAGAVSASPFPVPAVCTELTRLDADGFHQIVQAVEAEGGEMELFPDLFYHFLVILAVGIGVGGQYFFRNVFSFPVPDDPPGDQIVLGSGAGEVQVRAAEGDGRTGRPYVDLLCAAFI